MLSCLCWLLWSSWLILTRFTHLTRFNMFHMAKIRSVFFKIFLKLIYRKKCGAFLAFSWKCLLFLWFRQLIFGFIVGKFVLFLLCSLGIFVFQRKRKYVFVLYLLNISIEKSTQFPTIYLSLVQVTLHIQSPMWKNGH